MMQLSNLPKLGGYRKPAKRIGRGYGSKKGGHTVGRGQKGQKARGKVKPLFEGGQLPLVKRLPQMGGFKPLRHEDSAIFNLDKLKGFEKGEVVSPQLLVERGWLKRIPVGGVKILGRGNLSVPLNFKGFAYSKSAREKIQKAGGSAT